MALLNSPYPYYYSFTRSLLFAIGSGLFVFLFLTIFQPFGTYNFQHPHKVLFLAGYGIIAMLVLIAWLGVAPFVFPEFFKEERWTIGRQLGLLLVLVVSLATTGYVYQLQFFKLPFNGLNWAYFTLLTISVCFFPLLIITLVDYSLKFRRSNLALRPLPITSSVTMTQPGMYILSDENLKEKVVFTANELLFIKSSDNYIEVFLRQGKIDYEKKLIRCTLKNAETVLRPIGLLRSHRSYLVNLKNCTAIQGNSQGYKLFFEGVPETVPVSRSKKDAISELIN